MSTLEKLKERKDRENIVKVLQLIRYVNQELNRMKAKMRKLLEDRDQLDDRFKDYKSQIKKVDVQIKKLQNDLSSIIELAKMRKSTAIVNVTGTIYDRTVIQSPKASLTVKGNHKRVTIQEVEITGAHGEKSWEMIVSPLR